MNRHVFSLLILAAAGACSTVRQAEAPAPRPTQPIQARPAVARALPLRPPRQASVEVKGRVEDPAQQQSRLVAAREAVQARPEDTAARYDLGNVLFDLRQFDQALLVYDQVVRQAPEHAAAHINRGLCLKRLGRIGEAIAAYQEALRIRPEDPTALQNLAVALEGEGRLAETVEVLERLARVRINDLAVLARLAHDEYVLGRYRKAADHFEQIIRLDPGLASDYYNLGLCHFQLGNHNRALITWLTAFAHDSRNESVNKGLAVLYWKRWDYKQAWQMVLNCRAQGIMLDPQLVANLEKIGRGNF